MVVSYYHNNSIMITLCNSVELYSNIMIRDGKNTLAFGMYSVLLLAKLHFEVACQMSSTIIYIILFIPIANTRMVYKCIIYFVSKCLA